MKINMVRTKAFENAGKVTTNAVKVQFDCFVLWTRRCDSHAAVIIFDPNRVKSFHLTDDELQIFFFLIIVLLCLI